MSEQHNEEQENKVVTKGPGDLLQAARIQQGISVEDIARQMNLNARILQSIEDDDYGEIQSPIFMRGYLRTYARLVGVDEDNIIKLFGEFYHANDPDIKSIGNTAPEISSNDIRVKWMTYAVILGLVGLLSVWWVNNYRSIDDSSVNEPELSSSASVEKTNNTSDIHSEDSMPLLESSTKMVDETSHTAMTVNEGNINEQKPEEVMSVNDVKTEIIEPLNDVIEADPGKTDITADNTEKTNIEIVANIEPKSIEIDQDSSETTDISQAEEKKQFTKEVNATSGSDVLELNVISTSWGEITDASKFQLIQDLMNSGSAFRLVGQKPFKIFLGNGYGVEIKLNGKSVDFSSHIKSSNNTARFELENS